MHALMNSAIGAALLTFSLANAANAVIIPFSDVVDPPGVGVTLTVGGTESFSYTHDITDDINVATDIIGGGDLAIVLQDIGGSESTTIQFDLGPILALSGNVPNGGATFNFDLTTFSLIGTLQADGLLDVTIRVVQQGGPASNVVFSSSTLTGFAERPTDVPEPASLLLLGTGLLGLGWIARRRKVA